MRKIKEDTQMTESEIIPLKMEIMQSIFDCNNINTLLKAKAILLEETTG